MNDQRRRQYLAAMGIREWTPRHPEVQIPVAAAGGEEAVVPGEHPEAARVTGLQPHGEIGALEEGVDPATDPVLDAPLGGGVAAMDWQALEQAVVGCVACDLAQTRSRTVFGVGDRQADLMVIGEAPGAEEDRQGEPFVGRAGQLLNAMLQAIGLQRDQIFITNILKCRPPRNRDPQSAEVLRCEPFLWRQIELVRPRVILSAGRVSAQNLLQSDAPVGTLRGRVHPFGQRRIPLVVTYHPAYLLRSPEQKAKAWQDLQRVIAQLNESRAVT